MIFTYVDEALYPAEGITRAIAEHEQVDPSVLPRLDEYVSSPIFEKLTELWDEIDEEIVVTYIRYEITVYPTSDIYVSPK